MDHEEGMKKGPTRKGRRKIEIKFIADKSRRHITFSKRKAGIMKKAYELATLTGTQVLLLVASETGHVYTFATPRLQPLITEPEGKNLIQTCLNSAEADQSLATDEDEDGPGGQPAQSSQPYSESPPSPPQHPHMSYGVKREREPIPEVPFTRRPKYEKPPSDMELPPGYLPAPVAGPPSFPSLPPMFPRQSAHPNGHGGYPAQHHGPPQQSYGYPPQGPHMQPLSPHGGHSPQGYMPIPRSMHGHGGHGIPMSHQGPEPHLSDNEPN